MKFCVIIKGLYTRQIIEVVKNGKTIDGYFLYFLYSYSTDGSFVL